MKIFTESGIKWDKPNCVECGREMKLKKHKGKKIKYYDEKLGMYFTKRYFDKWICECGCTQVVETHFDEVVREGLKDAEIGIN